MEQVLTPNNRMDYGYVLMPDDGWKTSWAIGTTYSLDLSVLLGVPLALFQGKYLSETTDLSNLRADMLDALNQVQDKMFVFVHENNIRARHGYSMLMGFLDQNIWNVPVDDVHQNFHPKVWLVRYETESLDSEDVKYKYRLVVMSRNMTDASDFDIAVALEGDVATSGETDNDALIDMMSDLVQLTLRPPFAAKDKSAARRKTILKQFRKELKTVSFVAPESFSAPHFWPHTYGQRKSPLVADGRKWDELLVMSPFVDDSTLELLSARVKTNTDNPQVASADKRAILISQTSSLDKCKPTVLQKWDCYQWNSLLEEAMDEDGDSDSRESLRDGINLHAKIFILKAALNHDKKAWNHWFVGSTNCTHAGLYINKEAQLQLKSLVEGASPNQVCQGLIDAALIVPYRIRTEPLPAKDEEEQRAERSFLFALSHIGITAHIVKNEHGHYCTNVQLNEEEWTQLKRDYPDVRVSVRLFATDVDTWTLYDAPSHAFPGIYCQQLSTFLRVLAIFNRDHRKEFLWQMAGVEIPEERHGKMMATILDSEEKVMRYLMFCLDAQTEREQLKIGKELPSYHGTAADNALWGPYVLPIYEKLLLAASRDREALRRVKRNIERLRQARDKEGQPLLRPEFLKMWNLFAPYVS